MWKFWEYHLPLWSAENEGAGGGGDGTGGDGDAAAGGDGQTPGGDGGEGSSGDVGSGDGAKSPSSSILDFADKSGGQKPKDDGKSGDGEAWSVPDGIELPEHLVGSSAEDTLSKVAAAYQGARRELSKPGKGMPGEVPKDIKGYGFEADDKADDILKDLASEDSAKLLDPFREVALELGLPDETFRKFMEGGVRKLAENGVQLTQQASEGAAEVNGEAEFAALVAEIGQADATAAVTQIDTFGLKLAQANILQSQADIDEFAQMFGTKRATQIGQRMIVEMFGEKPIVPGDGVEGQMTYQEAKAALEQANALPKTDPNRQEKILAAEENLAKASSSRPPAGGQVKSSVLG